MHAHSNAAADAQRIRIRVYLHTVLRVLLCIPAFALLCLLLLYIPGGDLIPEHIRLLVLPALLSVLWMYAGVFRWLRLLQFTYDNSFFGTQLILMIFMGVCMHLSGKWAALALGTAVTLGSVAEIPRYADADFYTLQPIPVRRDLAAVTADIPYRDSKSLTLRLSAAIPLVEDGDSVVHAWLGLSRSQRMAPTEDDAVLMHELELLSEDFSTYADTLNLRRIVCLERMKPSSEYDVYVQAIDSSGLAAQPSRILLLPMFETQAEKALYYLYILAGMVLVGPLVWLAVVATRQLAPEAVDAYREGRLGALVRGEYRDTAGFLIPRRGYWVTPSLLLLNVCIFLLMSLLGHGFFSISGESLLRWGASFGPLVQAGEYWRLLSSTFLHGGLVHVAGNMVWLVLLGMLLEPVLGSGRSLLLYLFTGLAASLVSLYWHPLTVSVGASGAIFGLTGVMLALCLSPAYRNLYGSGVFYFVLTGAGINLLLGLTGNTDNAAHLGGLGAGLLCGLLVLVMGRRRSDG